MTDQRKLPPLPASNLLIDDHPLQLLPKLAVAIGVNEAIALQQLRFLLNRSANVRDGRRWVYNTHERWQVDVFPFWSIPTIRRVLAELEKAGYVVTASHYNRVSTDRTKWYTIDFARVAALEDTIAHLSKSADATDQSDQLEPISLSGPTDQIDQLQPETTSETTQKDISSVRASANEDASANDPATCLNAYERRRYRERLSMTQPRLDREIARLAALPRQGRTLRQLVLGYFEPQLTAARGGNRRRA